jgi:hypothetical protein
MTASETNPPSVTTAINDWVRLSGTALSREQYIAELEEAIDELNAWLAAAKEDAQAEEAADDEEDPEWAEKDPEWDDEDPEWNDGEDSE